MKRADKLRKHAEGYVHSITGKYLLDAADTLDAAEKALRNTTDALEMLQGGEWETVKRARAVLAILNPSSPADPGRPLPPHGSGP